MIVSLMEEKRIVIGCMFGTELDYSYCIYPSKWIGYVYDVL
jgi:hypothetical protein